MSSSVTASKRQIYLVPVALLLPLVDARPVCAKNVRAIAESVQRLGLLQPIVVVKDGDRFRIVAGRHRAAAYELLGRVQIEAEVWREGTDPNRIRLLSLHENHVRKDETVQDTLDRLNVVMAEHSCNLTEAAKLAKIKKGTASKIKTIVEKLAPEAIRIVNETRIGLSVAYEVARGSADAQTQIAWLKSHLAGQMSRDDIIEAARSLQRKGKPSKTLKLLASFGGADFQLGLPDQSGYEQLLAALSELRSWVLGHRKRATPIELLPHFVPQGAETCSSANATP
ncbi:MAG: ParB N-terminal domain-containing protein [Planctomycetales bacterium]|nr:ParB N-terminal domain-containing protein [Planctomycetales bacterium]